MRFTHTRAAAIAILLVFGAVLPPSPIRTRVQVGAQPAGDCCVPLPVVATSKAPAKGVARFELTLVDMQAIFSNRHVMFAGGWDAAFVALAYEIDRTGAYQMRHKPAPRVARQVGLEEGGFTSDLINPQIPGSPGLRSRPPTPGANRWARQGLSEATFTFQALVNTIARINKYGEPESGLRTATLAAARFMADGLAGIRPEVMQSDPAAAAIATVNQQVRTSVAAMLLLALPDRVALAAGRPAPVANGELPLSPYDIANAVFDIYRSVGDDGMGAGLYRLLNDDAEEQIFKRMLTLASARVVFGGTAPPGSPEDAIACRAFSLLVAMARPDTKNSLGLRSMLVNELGQQMILLQPDNRIPPLLGVAKAAVIMAGVESAAEAKALVDFVLHTAQTGARAELVNAEMVSILHGLIGGAGGPGPNDHRAEIAAAVEQGIANLEERKQSNTAGAGELRALDGWKAGGAAAKTVALNNTCGASPGDIKGRIILWAVVVDGLQVIEELFVGVPTIVEVQFDESREEDEVPLELSVGGQMTKLTAKRFDKQGRMFRSDPIVPGKGKS